VLGEAFLTSFATGLSQKLKGNISTSRAVVEVMNISNNFACLKWWRV